MSEENNAGAGGPIVKTGDAILQESKLPEGAVDSEKLTGIQQAGMRILLFVGIVGAATILALIAQYYAQAPKPPTIDFTKDAATVQTLLANYKALSDGVLSHTKDLFDMVVGKVLYPLVTLILGYIFGKRSAETTEG